MPLFFLVLSSFYSSLCCASYSESSSILSILAASCSAALSAASFASCSCRCSSCHSLQSRPGERADARLLGGAECGAGAERRRGTPVILVRLACSRLHSHTPLPVLQEVVSALQRSPANLQDTLADPHKKTQGLTSARPPPPPAGPGEPAPGRCSGRPPRTRRQSSAAPGLTPPAEESQRITGKASVARPLCFHCLPPG